MQRLPVTQDTDTEEGDKREYLHVLRTRESKQHKLHLGSLLLHIQPETANPTDCRGWACRKKQLRNLTHSPLVSRGTRPAYIQHINVTEADICSRLSWLWPFHVRWDNDVFFVRAGYSQGRETGTSGCSWFSTKPSTAAG